jgi:hypothetical protein
MCRYSGRALSGRGQICRDREQAFLNPVASHVVVESIKQLYRWSSYGGSTVRRVVRGDVTFHLLIHRSYV